MLVGLEKNSEMEGSITILRGRISKMLEKIFFGERIVPVLSGNGRFFRFVESERMTGFEGVSESVFHVLRLGRLPHPYFYDFIFLCASFWKRTS